MPIAALAVLVFCMSAAIDYCDCRCTLAVTARDPNAAALWSILQYVLGAAGFIMVVKVSLWLMVPECLGLLVGTRLALRKDPCKS
jgi:hypothetical protein